MAQKYQSMLKQVREKIPRVIITTKEGDKKKVGLHYSGQPSSEKIQGLIQEAENKGFNQVYIHISK